MGFSCLAARGLGVHNARWPSAQQAQGWACQVPLLAPLDLLCQLNPSRGGSLAIQRPAPSPRLWCPRPVEPCQVPTVPSHTERAPWCHRGAAGSSKRSQPERLLLVLLWTEQARAVCRTVTKGRGAAPATQARLRERGMSSEQARGAGNKEVCVPAPRLPAARCVTGRELFWPRFSKVPTSLDASFFFCMVNLAYLHYEGPGSQKQLRPAAVAHFPTGRARQTLVIRRQTPGISDSSSAQVHSVGKDNCSFSAAHLHRAKYNEGLYFNGQ